MFWYSLPQRVIEEVALFDATSQDWILFPFSVIPRRNGLAIMSENTHGMAYNISSCCHPIKLLLEM